MADDLGRAKKRAMRILNEAVKVCEEMDLEMIDSDWYCETIKNARAEFVVLAAINQLNIEMNARVEEVEL